MSSRKRADRSDRLGARHRHPGEVEDPADHDNRDLPMVLESDRGRRTGRDDRQREVPAESARRSRRRSSRHRGRSPAPACSRLTISWARSPVPVVASRVRSRKRSRQRRLQHRARRVPGGPGPVPPARPGHVESCRRRRRSSRAASLVTRRPRCLELLGQASLTARADSSLSLANHCRILLQKNSKIPQ